MPIEAQKKSKFSLHKMLEHLMGKRFAQVIKNNSMVVLHDGADFSVETGISHIMLKLVGVRFKIIFFLHYVSDKNATHYFNMLNVNERVSKAQSDDSDMVNFYMEMSNEICGELKRLLTKQLGVMGMSTPVSMTVSELMADISNNNLQVECHEIYKNDEQLVWGGSLYVFSEASLVFKCDDSSFPDELSYGEIELF